VLEGDAAAERGDLRLKGPLDEHSVLTLAAATARGSPALTQFDWRAPAAEPPTGNVKRPNPA